MPFEALQVPEEPGVWRCATHRSTTTRLLCGRCDKPICPRCTVIGPTGARCRDCASNRSSHVYQVGAKHLLISFGAAALLGAVGGALIRVAGLMAFWVLLYAPAIVPLLGNLVTRITGGKKGWVLALAVSLGLACGALGPTVLFVWGLASHAGPAALPFALLAGIFANPLLYVFLAVAIGGVWWWLK